MNEPKACQLCGFCDTLGVCATCPNDGEASWSPLVPTFVPEPAPAPTTALVTESAPETADPTPAPKSKAKGRK
jgi:hypothetical protein